MSFASRCMKNVLPTGVTALAGAAPQTGAGGTIVMGKPGQSPRPGSMSALVYAKATTNTLTITAKWQVSADGTTWRDCYVPNKAANVVVVTGTGSAVTDTLVLSAPDSVYSFDYARCVVVTGVTTAATGDEFSISYNFLKDR